MNDASLTLADGVVQLKGAITFSTVAGLLEQSHQQLEWSAPLSIDLSGVRRSDSAALALLLEWRRTAMAQQCSLTFIAPPTALIRLAEIGGVTTLLAMEG